jgi:hypothetical protein
MTHRYSKQGDQAGHKHRRAAEQGAAGDALTPGKMSQPSRAVSHVMSHRVSSGGAPELHRSAASNFLLLYIWTSGRI